MTSALCKCQHAVSDHVAVSAYLVSEQCSRCNCRAFIPKKPRPLFRLIRGGASDASKGER